MKNLLIISFFITVLSCGVNAADGLHCEDISDLFSICHESGVVLSVKVLETDFPQVNLNLRRFNSIAPGAFKNVSCLDVSLHDYANNKGPVKFINFTPESFDGMNTKLLEVGQIKFSVNPNPFRGVVGVNTLNLISNGFENFPVDFFADFPHLYSLTLEDSNLSMNISPKIFAKINKNLRFLGIEANVSSIEPKSFDRFSNLTFLRLVGGNIHRLQSGVFSGLHRLEVLRMLNNGIREIEADTLINLNLQQLYLENNRLEEVPNAENVKEFYLSNNSIQVLETSTFQRFSKLELLDLNDNQIDWIEPGAFSGLNLDVLMLKNNRIKFLDHDTFKGLSIRERLLLGGNDIQSGQNWEEEIIETLKKINLAKSAFIHLIVSYVPCIFAATGCSEPILMRLYDI